MSLILSRVHPRPATPLEEDRLRTENRALRRRVLALEDALLGAEVDALSIPLPRRERLLFRLLMRNGRLSIDQCMAALEAINPSRDGKTKGAVHRPMYTLRKLLRRHSVELRSERFGGYWIEPADKARLRATFAAEAR